MADVELYLRVFGFDPGLKPVEPLESRIKRFIDAASHSESLDDETFSAVTGSASKADYLLGNRHFIAELKTINGGPKKRIEERLRKRFSQPGSLTIIGRYGLAPILRQMHDGDEIKKSLSDLAGRSVRRHLQKSSEQILTTKTLLDLPESSGLLIIANGDEPMIEAAHIGYTIKAAMDTVDGGYPELAYIWISVESHRLRMPSGRNGFPQLLVSRPGETLDRLRFLGSMLDAWAEFNGSNMELIPHGETWSSMNPVFENGPPTLDFFR